MLPRPCWRIVAFPGPFASWAGREGNGRSGSKGGQGGDRGGNRRAPAQMGLFFTRSPPASSAATISKMPLKPLPNVSAEVMFQHDRTCCVCREPGLAVQIHHIDEDPTSHAIPNLAVLCLEHLEQTQTRGGFAKKLKAGDVVRYRDDWVRRVADRRDKADELVIKHAAGILPTKVTIEDWSEPSEAKVTGLLT